MPEPVTPIPAAALPNEAITPAPAVEPAEPGPEAEPEPEQPQTGPPWQNWLYTGPDGRIYTNIPLTATIGAIITWHSIPATDGAWQPTDAPATVMPDNHRPEPDEPATDGPDHTEEG